MRCATSCASANSASGNDGDTAVTAMALSCNASYAAFANKELSTPPEKATTTLSIEYKISRSFSSFSSSVTVVVIGVPLKMMLVLAVPAGLPRPPGSPHDRNCAQGAPLPRAQNPVLRPGVSIRQTHRDDNSAPLAGAASRDAGTVRSSASHIARSADPAWSQRSPLALHPAPPSARTLCAASRPTP